MDGLIDLWIISLGLAVIEVLAEASSGFDQKDTVFIYLHKTVFSYESEDMKKTLEIRIEYFLFCYWEGCIMCVLHTSTHDTGIHFLNHD